MEFYDSLWTSERHVLARKIPLNMSFPFMVYSQATFWGVTFAELSHRDFSYFLLSYFPCDKFAEIRMLMSVFHSWIPSMALALQPLLFCSKASLIQHALCAL